MLTRVLPPGVAWQAAGNDLYFLDFRDTVWTLGRFVLEGGNPPDPATYHEAVPWALTFSLYLPAWLLLAAVPAPLRYLTAVVVFQVVSLTVPSSCVVPVAVGLGMDLRGEVTRRRSDRSAC
jgi:hypothetical protein